MADEICSASSKSFVSILNAKFAFSVSTWAILMNLKDFKGIALLFFCPNQMLLNNKN